MHGILPIAVSCLPLAPCGLGAATSVCGAINDARASALTAGPQIPVCTGLPSNVAQGSVISVTGVELGPAEEANATDFPLRTSLAGVSVRLTIGGVNVDVFVLSAQQNRVRAMLPSGTPSGEGSLVVTYNGIASEPYRLQVLLRSFQVYHRGLLARAQEHQPRCGPGGQ